MTALLDVSVLVALAWPNHVHHDLVLAWFRSHQDGGWATCPTTQSGFVRVSSNQVAIPTAVSPAEAIDLLGRIIALPGHHFWVDDTSLATSPHLDATRVTSHRRVTDAHLVALATRNQGNLATLDRSVRSLAPVPEVVRWLLDGPT